MKACRGTKDGKPYQKLLEEIEAYFEQSTGTDKRTKIRATNLPPIYLQHQGAYLILRSIKALQTQEINKMLWRLMENGHRTFSNGGGVRERS